MIVLATDSSGSLMSSGGPGAAAAEPAGDASGADLESAKPEPKKITARPTSMDIIPEANGVKTLNIHFRWSLYPNSTIEVRLAPGPEVKGVELTPIYFFEHLKGKVRENLYDCLDHSDHGGKTHSFTKDKIVYNMIGRRNSLGNQGVHVEVYKENAQPADNPAAAYLQLDAWAVDKETLSLDLARDEFVKPGTLFVWYFRGDKLVWKERIRWPGYK